MRHRHLTADANPWSVVAIESILERGGTSDIMALLREIRRDPGGEAARNAVTVAAHIRPYGLQHLVPALVKQWRT